MRLFWFCLFVCLSYVFVLFYVNFFSWRDGKQLCNLINIIKPDLIPSLSVCAKSNSLFSFMILVFFLYAYLLSLLCSTLIILVIGFWNSLTLQSNAIQNLQTAIDVAYNEYDIPKLIDAKDIASDSPDELSNMTYLSYFRDKVTFILFVC
jgi:hypothetical protein